MIPLLNRGGMMKGFVQGADRQQTTLLPECLDDWVGESNPVRAVDVFVDALELRDLGFDGVDPAATGRPAYHPSPMLKLYIYGYLNRVQSSRRLEREAGRNLEVMWLTGRLVPDHKTIADFRKDNGPAIKKVCARFVELCRKMGLLAKASVAVDPFMFTREKTIVSFAARTNVPAIYPWKFVVTRDGGLLSYGPDLIDIFRRGAPYVDQVLRGVKPADLPVQVPIKFEMAVNARTAKALGLAVPLSIILGADEVID
jgi:transposase